MTHKLLRCWALCVRLMAAPSWSRATERLSRRATAAVGLSSDDSGLLSDGRGEWEVSTSHTHTPSEWESEASTATAEAGVVRMGSSISGSAVGEEEDSGSGGAGSDSSGDSAGDDEYSEVFESEGDVSVAAPQLPSTPFSLSAPVRRGSDDASVGGGCHPQAVSPGATTAETAFDENDIADDNDNDNDNDNDHVYVAAVLPELPPPGMPFQEATAAARPTTPNEPFGGPPNLAPAAVAALLQRVNDAVAAPGLGAAASWKFAWYVASRTTAARQAQAQARHRLQKPAHDWTTPPPLPPCAPAPEPMYSHVKFKEWRAQRLQRRPRRTRDDAAALHAAVKAVVCNEGAQTPRVLPPSQRSSKALTAFATRHLVRMHGTDW